jgi:O-antigen/teichoic acid export membrane protein
MLRSSAIIFRAHHPFNWATVDQALVSGANFVTGILLARFLGIEVFGRFTLLWMAVLFVTSVQMALVSAPMMSVGPKQAKASAPAYFGAVFTHQGAFALASSGLLLGVAYGCAAAFPEWSVGPVALALAVAALAHQSQDFLRRYLFTRHKARAACINDLVRYTLQIGLLVAMYSTASLSLSAVLWVITIAAAASLIAGAGYLERPVLHGAALAEVMRRHWRSGGWLAGSTLLQWAANNGFMIFAGGLLGPTAVGALRAAQNVMGFAHVLVLGYENAVLPKASHAYHQGGATILASYLRRTGLSGLAVFAVPAVIAVVVPEFWLQLLYGEAFAGYGHLVRWWAGVYLLIVLAAPLSLALRAVEQTGGLFVARAATAAFSVAAAIPFIRLWDADGAVAGMLGTNLVLVVILTQFVTRVLKRSTA